GAILASNTSYLSIDEIAATTKRPHDVLGLHFFSPANVMKLLEVVRGAKTAPDVLETAMQLARRIRKVAVIAGVTYGFIGNRMLMPRQMQAMQLLLEGATPEQIERVHVDFGMPMGPFQMADLAGVDSGRHRDPDRIESIRDKLCALGRWGQKKGAGFYDYDEKRQPSPSGVVAEVIDEFRARTGARQREITAEEIIERTLYTMVNEGALILEGGFAQRASDIDVVWVYGYGWPVYRGGPMFWADTEGLAKIVEGLKRQQARLGPDFRLSDLLAEKAAAGQGPRRPRRVGRTRPRTGAVVPRSAAAQRLGVELRPESHDPPLAEIEHRPLDHRRLRQHQRDRLLLVQPRLVGLGQLAEGGAGAVQQPLPAMFPRPAAQPVLVDSRGPVVVKGVGDAMRVEPGARLLHRVAVADPVDRDHASSHRLPSAGRRRFVKPRRGALIGAARSLSDSHCWGCR